MSGDGSISYSDVILRYKGKIKDFCDGIDPYSLKIKDCNDPLPPNVTYYDLVTYCLNKESSYTLQSFKARKTLESYKFYESGWVKELGCKKISIGSLVISKVSHSMKLREKALHVWISVDKEGIILTAHCTCMAGLGEVCSHVGATLFLLEDWQHKSMKYNISEVSCTDVLSKWLIPGCKVVEMAKAIDIIWNDKITENLIEPLPGMNDEEIDMCLRNIQRNNGYCPLMAHREPFADKFVPKTKSVFQELLLEVEDEDDDNFEVINNLFLASFYNAEFLGVDLKCLREIAEMIHLNYTDDEIHFIESKTRKQSDCKLWYRFRTGRVTGSTFKRVCRTSLISPSIALIEQICFPEKSNFLSIYTAYGKKHENDARNDYHASRVAKHENFQITISGLVINNNFPHWMA